MIEHWYIALYEKLRLPLWLFGILCFLFIAIAIFSVSGMYYAGPNSAPLIARLADCLFFAFINSSATVGAVYVTQRCNTALDQLHSADPFDPAELAAHRERLRAFPWRSALLWVAIFVTISVTHNLAILGGPSQALHLIQNYATSLAASLGGLMTWLVVGSVVMAFVRNAHLFLRIAQQRELSLATADKLAPFGTAATAPTLALMGTQMSYPLLSLGGSFNPVAVIPGFLVTVAAALYLLLRPTLPLHNALRDARNNELGRIQAEIEQWRVQMGTPPPTEQLASLQPLLSYRGYVRSLPVWPFDMPLALRWAFYLTIPPLTWVAAALVEQALERFV